MSTYKKTMHKILFTYVNRLVTDLTANTNPLLTNAMFRYLDVVYQSDFISPSLLAERVGVSRAAASKMIKKLLETGLVKQNQDVKPRCPYTISLTPKAKEIYKISCSKEKELIDLMDKYFELHKIDDIDEKASCLLSKYENSK